MENVCYVRRVIYWADNRVEEKTVIAYFLTSLDGFEWRQLHNFSRAAIFTNSTIEEMVGTCHSAEESFRGMTHQQRLDWRANAMSPLKCSVVTTLSDGPDRSLAETADMFRRAYLYEPVAPKV